jgi:cell volume regulation protein A
MAVFLTLALVDVVLHPGTSIAALLPELAMEIVVGGAVGWAVAAAALWALNHLRLAQEGLYPAVTVAVALGTYGLAAVAGGSGFLAVYVAGVLLGRRDFLHRRSLLRFHDALAWLAQIAMFLVLGLLVFPADLPDVAGPALVVAAALILVARPVAAAVTLLPTGMAWREVAFVSWVGLRGAVPIVLATFPLVEGVPEAARLFDVVFFVVLASVLVQGTTTPAAAGLLGVRSSTRPSPPPPIEAVGAIGEGTGLHELTVVDGAPAAGRRLVDLGLPAGALVVLVTRDGAFVVPTGATALRAGDQVLVLADRDALAWVSDALGGRPIPHA